MVLPTGAADVGEKPRAGQVGGQRFSSHCSPALVPQGHGLGIGQEMIAEKCCCNEPNHKGQPGG